MRSLTSSYTQLSVRGNAARGRTHRPRNALVALAASTCLFFGSERIASAQCPLVAVPNGGFPGINGGGTVAATIFWDHDDDGSTPELLVVGGSFIDAGGVSVSSLATFDGSTWSSPGDVAGLSATVSALAVLPNGKLVVAGEFSSVGGVPAANIAQFDGTTWSPLGAGTSDSVQCLSIDGTGNLLVGGSFLTAGGVVVNHVARWNGASWSPIGSGANGTVLAIESYNGEVIIGGNFTSAGGVAANFIARASGATWTAFGTGANGVVTSLKRLSNNTLVAGGGFSVLNGVNAPRVARWNGSAWSTIGGGLASGGGNVMALAELPNGDLVAGGDFFGLRRLARFDGASWTTVGAGIGDPSSTSADGVGALAVSGTGHLAVGGRFLGSGESAVRNIAVWDGTTMNCVGRGFNGVPTTVDSLPNGDLIAAGGGFDWVDGVSARNIARWNGTAWSALGDGLDGTVNAVLGLPNGDLIAGGNFGRSGMTVVNGIARWDGASWTPLGGGLTLHSGFPGTVNALALLPNGDIVAAGFFNRAGGGSANNIARWNGTSWSLLGTGTNGSVKALAVLAGGSLVVGGSFTLAGGVIVENVALYSGTSWSAMASGLRNGAVEALIVRPNGELVAGGTFTASGAAGRSRIAQWTGAAWVAMGTGMDAGVLTLANLPDGSLVAGGDFNVAGGLATGNLARWEGGWSALAALGTIDLVRDLAWTEVGQLAIAGPDSAGFQPSFGFARLVSTCSATATPYSSGCNGLSLSATKLPWLGNSSRSVASGFGPNSLAIAVAGLSPTSLPLSTFHPLALAGCLALTSPQASIVLIPVAGQVTWNVAIPQDPGMIGVSIFQQAIELALDSSGNIVVVRSTNGLDLRVGDF